MPETAKFALRSIAKAANKKLKDLVTTYGQHAFLVAPLFIGTALLFARNTNVAVFAFSLSMLIRAYACIGNNSRRSLALSGACIVIGVIAAISPLDVTVVGGSEVTVKFLPVSMTPIGTRDLEERGLVKNVDFLEAHNRRSLIRWCIVFKIPL